MDSAVNKTQIFNMDNLMLHLDGSNKINYEGGSCVTSVKYKDKKPLQ